MTNPFVQHTTSIVTDEPVSIIVGDCGDGFWSPVLHEYLFEIAPTLSIGPTRVMNILFGTRDRRTGRSTISRADLGTACRLSKAAISEALTHLVEHTRRPLAIESASVFVVMPGRVWRGRTQEEEVRRREHQFAQANTSSPPRTASLEIARAQYKNQNQPDQKREEEESKPERSLRDSSGLAGSKAGMVAIENRLFRQDDERSKALFRFLSNAGIREPLRSMLVDSERVTLDECAAIVAEVKAEASSPGSDILSPGSVMAMRLCKRFGLEMPKKNEAIARMRANGTLETVKRLAAMQKGARL